MIVTENLSFAYRRNSTVLESLTFTLSSGHIYGLLGSNATGKTTLLKLLSGFVAPASGTIKVMDKVPFSRKPSFLADMFFVSDEVEVPNMNMERYVKMTAPFYPKFNMEEFESYMREFNVSLTERISDLSYGQRKKAIISFALACNTRLLLMDEPTNGLDIPSKGQFRRVISDIASEDRCIIISTHQVRDLDSLIDAVIIINNKSLLINDSLYNISQRLRCSKVNQGDKPLYSEPNAAGEWGIMANPDGVEGDIDIELLFNATLACSEEVINLLK